MSEIIRQIDTLHPLLRKPALRTLFDTKSMGLEIGVFETRRLADRQVELLAGGTSRVDHSWHEFDLAIDIWPRAEKGWPTQKAFEDWRYWDLLGQLGERNGFSWGGRWKRWHDKCHFEMTFGLRKAVIAPILERHGREALHDYINAWVDNQTTYEAFFKHEPKEKENL
jgi:hypothetical protein